MSTPTNFNQPSTPNYDNPNNSDNSKRMLTLAGIAIAVLLGACIFLLVGKYRTSQQLDTTQTELNTQNEALDKLNASYNETVAQLESEKGKNAELDAKINEQLQQLESNKNQISQMIKEKKDYRAALASFERQKKEYVAQIDELKQKVGVLTDENTRMGGEIQNLNSSLTETQTKLAEEGTAKAALISEKTQLAKKVDIASAVKVMNVQVSSVQVKKSGKEKEKSKAKNVDKLKICFRTEANEVVPAGEEVFQIRIIDPTGTPLADESLGSGVAQDKKTESDVRYTTTATTSYSNSETDVCGYWQPGQNFAKGTYNVEVYNKGYLVGKGNFKLK